MRAGRPFQLMLEAATAATRISARIRLGVLGAAPAALLCVLSNQAQARERPLSLDEAIVDAVRGNPDLQRERIAIESTDAQLQQAEGKFDLQLNGDASLGRSKTPPPLTFTEYLQRAFSNDLTLGFGVARPLETGGALQLGLRTVATQTNSALPCNLTGTTPVTCTVYASSLGLTLTHPLLRGFGTEVARANIRRASIQKDQALQNRQMRAANVLRDVVNTYWELAYATRDLSIRRKALDLARTQLQLTQSEIEVGRRAPVEAAAVERAIGDRMQDVVQAEQALFFRTMELQRLFGLDASGSLDPLYEATDAPVARPHAVDIASELQRAFDSNPQLQALKLGIQLSEVDIQTARSTVKPQLDFQGQVSSTGRQRDWPHALRNTLETDDIEWSAGLTFSFPVQNRTARGQLRAARLEAESSTLEAHDFQIEIRNQVMRLASMIHTASRRIDLAQATIGFANQNLEAERDRFAVGRSTNNDVLLRQQELANSEIQALRATVDLLQSDTTLAALTGDLLERYRMVLR